jgi:hypothetical protein
VVALITASLIAIGLLLLLIPMAKRRPIGTPLSWGEAMVAAVYSFFLMFWVYGVIPHLWLTWADNELKWRPDNLVFGPGDIIQPVSQGGAWFPMTISYQTLRDLIAVGIYVVLLGGQMFLWTWWQQRGTKAAAASAELATSDYGRPLVRKG